MSNAKLTTGLYQPTDEFRAIAEHVAVCRESDNGLVAVVGPYGDEASAWFARMFAAAPELLAACKTVLGCEAITCSECRDALTSAVARAEGAAQ